MSTETALERIDRKLDMLLGSTGSGAAEGRKTRLTLNIGAFALVSFLVLAVLFVAREIDCPSLPPLAASQAEEGK